MAEAAREGEWLNGLLTDLGKQPSIPIIYEDNRSCIVVAETLTMKRNKHIDIKYHYVRDLVAKKKIEVKYIESGQQVADIMTKGLGPKPHQKLRELLGVLPVM